MKLHISQMLLEEVRFSHVGEFLGHEPSNPAGPHDVNFQVQALDVKEPDKFVVRLKVQGQGKGVEQYNFSASYLVLFAVEDHEEVEGLPKKMAVTGATMLMPLLREVVANITMRGRFGAVWLPPINFNEAVGEPTSKPASSPSRKGRTKKKAPV